MPSIPEMPGPDAPARFERPGALAFAIGVAAAAFLVTAFRATDVSIGELLRGGPSALRILGEMFPPSLDTWAPSPDPCSRPSRWRWRERRSAAR